MEIEFLIRRVLKQGHDYAREQHEKRNDNAALALYRYTSQIQLLNYLEKEFLERNKNDDKN